MGPEWNGAEGAGQVWCGAVPADVALAGGYGCPSGIWEGWSGLKICNAPLVRKVRRCMQGCRWMTGCHRETARPAQRIPGCSIPV